MKHSRRNFAQNVFLGILIVIAPFVRADAQAVLGPNLYAIKDSVGTVVALIGPDGVFLVDSGYREPDPSTILSALRGISNAPVRFLVNTCARRDHTYGNENFARLGATILGRPQARERMAHPVFSANGVDTGTPLPLPEAALPGASFDSALTLHMNGEEIELIPAPRAYTDGDTLVHFVHADVIVTGEIFRSISYPDIDRGNGGTLSGLLDGLEKIIALAGPATKIVPRHDTIANRTAVIAQRDMILVLRDRVAVMLNQGRSEKEVVAVGLNADYPSRRLGSNRLIRALYEELAP
jgi:cyclase